MGSHRASATGIGVKAALVLATLVAGTACASANQVQGVVLEIDGDLTTVDSFVLRTVDGETLTIVPAADGDFSFPLPHLNDHRASLAPIIVVLDRSVDPPLAISIRDAESDAFHG